MGELTICKFFKLPRAGGKNSKSLSPKYKARSVSVRKRSQVTVRSVKGINLTHHEEIAGQSVLIQIVVRQIQYLEHGECTEAAWQ